MFYKPQVSLMEKRVQFVYSHGRNIGPFVFLGHLKPVLGKKWLREMLGQWRLGHQQKTSFSTRHSVAKWP